MMLKLVVTYSFTPTPTLNSWTLTILMFEQITKKNEVCTCKVICSSSVEFGPRWWCHLTNHTLPSMLLMFKHIVCFQRQKNKIKRFTHFVLLYGLQNKFVILKDELPMRWLIDQIEVAISQRKVKLIRKEFITKIIIQTL